MNIINKAQKQKLRVGNTLDAEKAFDKVLWPYSLETVCKYGMSPTFIKWLIICTKSQMLESELMECSQTFFSKKEFLKSQDREIRYPH